MVGNYLSQLRPYSYADLVLLLAATGASASQVLGCSLLWFGFLIHLEWQHHDRGRLPWPWFGWAIPWLLALVILWTPWVVPFFLLSALYSLKKRFRLVGLVSPLLNGGLKMSLLALVPSISGGLVAVVFVACSLRNLAGDVRDAAKDADEGLLTVPVLLGYRRATPLVYPASLALTSLLWTVMGGLPFWALAVAWVVEFTTYRLTPR